MCAKFTLTFLLAIFVVSIRASPHPPHYENLLKLTNESLDDCYEDDANSIKVEITDGFDALVEGSRDPPRNAKCLRYCIMRKNKLFNDEHQLNSEEMLHFFEKLYNGVVDEAALQDVVTHCKEEAAKETDSCERAHTAAMCILGTLKERGYDQL